MNGRGAKRRVRQQLYHTTGGKLMRKIQAKMSKRVAELMTDSTHLGVEMKDAVLDFFTHVQLRSDPEVLRQHAIRVAASGFVAAFLADRLESKTRLETQADLPEQTIRVADKETNDDRQTSESEPSESHTGDVRAPDVQPTARLE